MDNSEILKHCKAQGYVPLDCTLDGMLVWLLVKDHRNPCVGCNQDCIHKKGNNTSHNEILPEEYYKTTEKEKIKRKHIEKRNKLNINSEPIVYVETDNHEIELIVMIPNEECGYTTHFKTPQEAATFIPSICNKYHSRQVFIETNGFGLPVYDCLINQDIDNIDVVPIYFQGMRAN